MAIGIPNINIDADALAGLENRLPPDVAKNRSWWIFSKHS